MIASIFYPEPFFPALSAFPDSFFRLRSMFFADISDIRLLPSQSRFRD
jgi:hypothetical protein